jgi:predicted alpha/beta hydrolase family esterase
MTKQVLFIQGAGDGTHDAWDNKLVASLEAGLGPHYTVRYPRMPNEGDPNYPTWKAELYEQFDALDEGAILVGHSVGGAFLIHALAEHQPKRKWGAVLLLAPPFFGAGGWLDDDIDPRKLAELTADLPVFIFHGASDDEVPVEHMKLYAAAIPHATPRLLADRDHQLNNDLGDVARDIRDLQSR